MRRNLALIVALAVVAVAPSASAQRNSEAVEVKVDDLQATPFGVSLTLRSSRPDEELHMMIGVTEGEAIARALDHDTPPRPMTHDLIKMILDGTGWHVRQALIRAVRGNTYLANLVLEKGGEVLTLDVRPSDAMAIAVRCDAKILVNQEVFDAESQREQPAKPGQPDDITPSRQKDLHL